MAWELGTENRPEGAVGWFAGGLVLAPAFMLAIYIEVASSVDRAYRSAQSLPPAVGPVIGYSLAGVAGPLVGGLVAFGLLRSRRAASMPVAIIAVLAEAVGLAVAAAAGLWMLHAGVT